VQVAAFLNALERSGLYQPTLVVCPATMLRQWRRELRAWAPRLRPAILHESAVSSAALSAARGNKKDAKIKIMRDCVGDPRGVLLTTYEHLRVMREQLLPMRWGYAILDEGHTIRNPDADITICAKQLQTVHRLIMTGAPIQNRLSELWSLFDFCFPGKLGTLPVFQAQFAVPIQVGQDKWVCTLHLVFCSQNASRCTASRCTAS
jgi:DNA excision repair protein ERCC-6